MKEEEKLFLLRWNGTLGDPGSTWKRWRGVGVGEEDVLAKKMEERCKRNN